MQPKRARSAPPHFQGPTGKLHPTAEPTSPTKAASAASRGKAHHRPWELAAPSAPGYPRGPGLRTEVRIVPGEGAMGFWTARGPTEEVAAPREAWGLGPPGRSAAPRSPDAFHLASAAAEAARPPALSTAPSRGRGRRARPAAAPDHHLPPRAHPQPGQSWTPRSARLPAGRAPTAGEGDYAPAFARSPPRCSRPVPRQVP